MNKLIDVKIFNNGKFLNKIAKKRPLRLMPSRGQGVVYKKRVYEVLKGNKIDISHSSYDKDECPLINFNKTINSLKILLKDFVTENVIKKSIILKNITYTY